VVAGRKVGAQMRGICVAAEQRIVEGTMTFERQITPQEVPPFKFYLMRHFPDYENPEKPIVHDLLVSNVTNARIGEAWEGDADIRFMPSHFEEVADLLPIEPVKGFFFQVGMTITGGKVIHRYKR
jgi:acetoacetate decarboxylase